MNRQYIFNKKKGVILYIYKYECAICNYVDIQNHVHHIDKDHFNNDAFNLVVLCKKCHVFVHKNSTILSHSISSMERDALQLLNSYL